jgi:hypothetical protein
VCADEEQLEAFIRKPGREGSLHGVFLQELKIQLARRDHTLMTHGIDEGMTRSRQQPSLRTLWNTVPRPSGECLYQPVAERVLGYGKVVRVDGEIGYCAGFLSSGCSGLGAK